jgi:hypothetical protein
LVTIWLQCLGEKEELGSRVLLLEREKEFSQENRKMAKRLDHQRVNIDFVKFLYFIIFKN